jgi:hypothetical protein
MNERQCLIEEAQEEIENMLDNGHAYDSPHIAEQKAIIRNLQGANMDMIEILIKGMLDDVQTQGVARVNTMLAEDGFPGLDETDEKLLRVGLTIGFELTAKMLAPLIDKPR